MPAARSRPRAEVLTEVPPVTADDVFAGCACGACVCYDGEVYSLQASMLGAGFFVLCFCVAAVLGYVLGGRARRREARA